MIKKKLVKLSIILALLLFLFNSFYVSNALCGGQLSIKIWSDKDSFFVREPILVYYEFKNVGDEPIKMIFDALHEYFNIKDQSGKGYHCMLLTSFASASDTLKLGQSHQGRLNITGMYGITSPGQYTIYLESPAWGKTPPAISNTIKIKVKEPTGDEKKALDMFLYAEKLRWSKDKDPKKWALGFLEYQELVDKYPNSIYAPLSLDCALGVYQFSRNLEERRKIIPVCKRLIEEYPNSLYFMSTFTTIVEVYEILKDKEGAIKTMKELIKKHPNTNISERAEYWLEKIEKWEFE